MSPTQLFEKNKTYYVFIQKSCTRHMHFLKLEQYVV